MTAGADELLPVLKAALPFVERVASGETTRPIRPEEKLEAIQLAQDIRRLVAEREAQPQRSEIGEPPSYCKARNLRPYDPRDCFAPDCACKP